MENNTQLKINFKQSRSIGKMFGVIISWLKINYLHLIKATFIAAIVSTVFELAMLKWNVSIINDIGAVYSLLTTNTKLPKGIISKYLIPVIFAFIGFIVFLLANSYLLGSTFEMLNIYPQRDLNSISIKDYYKSKSSLKRMLHIFGMGLFAFLLFFIFLALCSPIKTLVKSTSIPYITTICLGFLFLCIPLTFITISYGSTNLKFFGAFKQGFSLGSRYWGRCFVFYFVLAIIVGLITSVFSIPYHVMTYMYVDYHTSLGDGNPSTVPFYTYILYTLAIIIWAVVNYFASLVLSVSSYVAYNSYVKHREEKVAFKKNNEKVIDKEGYDVYQIKKSEDL